MKKILFTILMGTATICGVRAQETIYPAPAQTQTIALTNATIHVGNGQVIENGLLLVYFNLVKLQIFSLLQPRFETRYR